MSTFQARIAIVGGGPSGLALGQLLHQRGIYATIYELRAEPTREELAKPSGMLDLHEESGLAVIRECGLWDAFRGAMGDCSEAMRVIDRDGSILHADEGEISYRPEIARNALTELLIRYLPPDIIKWNHKVKTIRSQRNIGTGATEIILDFGSNGVATYDFVVGADGAWSRVRKLLSDVQPIYSGAQHVTATIRHVSTKYPHLSELCGSGSLCALGGGNGIITQRGPWDSVRLYAALSTPQECWLEIAGLKGKSAAEVKRLLLGDDKLFGNWATALQDLLGVACDEETSDNPGCEADVKPYYMLPVGHRWEHQPGATVIGDAAHLMTPWAGEGVNLALWDSLDLANAIGEVPEAADPAEWQAALELRIREFEETMLTRAREKAEETDRNRAMFLSENGAQEMANFFKMIDNAATIGTMAQES